MDTPWADVTVYVIPIRITFVYINREILMYEIRAHVKRNKVGFGGTYNRTNVAHGDAISTMVTHKYNDVPRGTACIYNI